jgi:mannose-6-phosphate isomerase-like protein (cupin superfamily)
LTAPIALPPGGGEAAELGPVRFVLKAGGEQTKGAYSLIEAEGPSFATPHVHHDREEAFFVLEGSITFLAGEDQVEATPGSFLLVPRETIHAFRANGVARLIIIHSPGGFEGFFKKGAEAISKGDFDLEFRDRLATEFGVTYFDDVKF